MSITQMRLSVNLKVPSESTVNTINYHLLSAQVDGTHKISMITYNIMYIMLEDKTTKKSQLLQCITTHDNSTQKPA